MAKLIPCQLSDGTLYGYGFYCPACDTLHHFNVAVFQPMWSFDGNLDAPTFGPSLRMIGGNGCHLFVLGGMIQYCPDSRHELAGKTVPMVDYDFERRCPVSTLHTINGIPVGAPLSRPAPSDSGIFAQSKSAPPPMVGAPISLTDPSVTQQPVIVPVNATVTASSSATIVRVHRAECGNVGNVGNVGDLGSNAKS